MRYRKLDANGDYVFGNGRHDFLTDAAAVTQAIATRLKLFEGEWFLDTTFGTPWSTQILGTVTQKMYDTALKVAILGVQGVKDITQYSSSLDPRTRQLTVQATVVTQFGQTTVNLTSTVPTGYGIGGFGLSLFGI